LPEETTMATTWQDVLNVLKARGYRPCGEAAEWAAAQPDQSLSALWDTCPRGDWMLWLAGRLGVDRRILVAAACDCAEQAWAHCRDGGALTAAMLVVHVAREWCAGRADLEDVRAAASAADDAAFAAYADRRTADRRTAAAADAAAYAAYGGATAYGGAADAAATAADDAAATAADDAADAADAARSASLAESARRVRARISVALIAVAVAEATV
jgi:hypothetical protein